MLALAMYRANQCPCGCGNERADTLAPEGAVKWRTRRIRCQARQTLVEAQNAANEGGKLRNPEAVLWTVTKVR